MRIVAGMWRGRRLRMPAGPVRPTADRVREAWMSIVHGLLPGARVLDLCAGSGALGLEALSRGAKHATLVESDARVLRTLRENIDELDAGELSTIVRRDARSYVASLGAGAFDVAFADPPYASTVVVELAEAWLKTPFSHVLGVEHSAKEHLPGPADTRRYGDTAITFYRVSSQDS